MAIPVPKPTKTRAKELLDDFRSNPVGSSGHEEELTIIYRYLANNGKANDGLTHWFCAKAGDLTREAATFLLRLFAYTSDNVNEWKWRLIQVLHGCCECVAGMNEAKFSSRHTYFGAFDDNLLQAFYTAFQKWEVEIIHQALRNAGVTTSESAKKSLTNAPPPVTYHLLSTLEALQDSAIVQLLETPPINKDLRGWPKNRFPAGMILLLLHAKQPIRDWALSISSQFTEMPWGSIVGPYETALKILLRKVEFPEIPPSQVVPSLEELELTTDLMSIWRGLGCVVKILPPEAIISYHPGGIASDLKHVILGHLHDTEQHFVGVLQCTCRILVKLKGDLWKDDPVDYPSVVFDAIKDNNVFAQLLARTEPNAAKMLNWIKDYINSIWGKPAMGDVLAKIFGFVLGELQHGRFQRVRPTILRVALELLGTTFQSAAKETDRKFKTAVLSALDVHTDLIVSVAFADEYRDVVWATARQAARDLVETVLTDDVDDIVRMLHWILSMANPPSSAQGADTTLPDALAPREKTWLKVYATMKRDDAGGISLLLRVAARIAHFDQLHLQAYSCPATVTDVAVKAAFDRAVRDVNKALKISRGGFRELVKAFANTTMANVLLEMLQESLTAKHLIILMFSPAPELHTAAEAVVGQAFEVYDRQASFRALLENLPEQSMSGLLAVFERFDKVTPNLKEACGLAKALVRCMTDVIEVLCGKPDGLLLNNRYVIGNNASGSDAKPPAAQLPRLWDLMTEAMAIIFKRTQFWTSYFDNKSSVEWMRDALIFGRDMLAQRHILEYAALTAQKSATTETFTSHQLSAIGKNMVQSLQPVLLEMFSWLRITDQEILHQSFAYFQSLITLFHDFHITPLDTTLEKFANFAKSAQAGRAGAGKEKTRLDDASLTRVLAAVASFDPDEDVVIVERPPSSSSSKPKPLKQNKLNFKPRPRASPSKAGPSNIDSDSDVEIIENVKPKAKPQVSRGAERPTAIAQKRKPDGQQQPPALIPQKRRLSSPAATSSRSGYSSGRASVPADSSEEESDDESDEDGKQGLRGLTKLQVSPAKPKVRTEPKERRQLKMIDGPASEKDIVKERRKQREELRRQEMRLKPDISPLHRMILSWDYHHNGPLPPAREIQPRLLSIKDTYRDHQEYFQVFEPLLRLECWAQVSKSKEDALESVACRIISLRFIDTWLDLDLTFEEAPQKEMRFMETDIVLLRSPTSNKSILGKTMSYKNTSTAVMIGIRVYTGSSQKDPGLTNSSIWRVSKVFSLSTIHREYGALISLPYYDVADYIFRPRLAKPPRLDPAEIRRAMASHQVNEPQAKAILSAMQTDGFSLIQGPPGTGKTTTICGLVGAFLSSRKRPATVIHPGRPNDNQTSSFVPKVLLCAPSNAAIDEVAKRLKGGVRRSDGTVVTPSVVRVGADASINISVKDISLDSLVDRELETEKSGAKESVGDVSSIRAEIESLKTLKLQKQEELSKVHDNMARIRALENEIGDMNNKRSMLTEKLNKARDQQTSNNRLMDATRRKLRVEVLSKADVICSTLSGAGHDILEQFEFEMIIIDEAAQAIELSSLIPFKYRSKRCIMVGDPQQLPPTVLSPEASKYGYDQSLFVRMQKSQPDAVHLLSIQYRMHPDISILPSRVFYDGRLKDGPEMAKKTEKPWHSNAKFGVYKFFNARLGKEEQAQSGHSLLNREECRIAVALYSGLLSNFSTSELDFRVGIVSMYRAQVVELRKAFERRFGRDILSKVDFNSVDGFQGQEKDIIILSCVRAGPAVNNVGFLSDVRRMNVALTRSRSSLFILGSGATLERSDATWKSIVDDARSRSCYVDVDPAYFSISKAPSGTQTSPRKATASSAKSAKSQEAPVPQGLSTPKELKGTLKSKSSTTSIASKAGNTSGPAGSPLKADTRQALTGQKRTHDEAEPGEIAEWPAKVAKIQTAREGPAAPLPPRPIVRKPKPKGNNLFIPKRKQGLP